MKKTLRSAAGIFAATMLYLTPTPVNAQWSYLGTPGFSAGTSTHQSMVLDSKGRLYVSYNDQSLNKGSVKMYNGSAWVNIGIDGFTPSSAEQSSLAVGPGDSLYFSYQDGPGGQASVMRFNGTSWIQVGSPGISMGTATYTCIEVDPTGVPVMAYIDAASGRACVKYFNGVSWIALGASAEVSPGAANYLSMDMDQTGMPWIAFADATSSPGNNATVMYFNGTTWQMAGSQGFTGSVSGINFLDFTISPNNEAYVAYSNPFAMMTGGVHKFNGTSWVMVDTVGNTPGSYFNSIAVDVNDVPYMNYADGGGPGSAKRYNASTTDWEFVGSPMFTGASTAFNTNLVDGNTFLYVAFCDGTVSSKTSVMRYQLCNPADQPTVSVSSATVCEGDSVFLTITSGSLNDDTDWGWYSGSCGGTFLGNGTSTGVEANDTLVLYVNGEGTCVFAGDTCTAITISPYANPATPVATQVGTTATVTSSSATGNQWYTNGNPIAGATSQNYIAPTGGWYYVTVTNVNGCSATSDSIFVAITGLNEISGAKASVYPVPFNRTLHVNLSSASAANLQMSIQDVQGRTVYTASSLQMNNSFDLSALASGLYYMVLQNENERQVYRIEKQ